MLSRKVGEKIIVADNIEITVCRISGDRVSVGLEAPREIEIRREELEPRERPAE